MSVVHLKEITFRHIATISHWRTFAPEGESRVAKHLPRETLAVKNITSGTRVTVPSSSVGSQFGERSVEQDGIHEPRSRGGQPFTNIFQVHATIKFGL